jgi:hypothetical protein
LAKSDFFPVGTSRTSPVYFSWLITLKLFYGFTALTYYSCNGMKETII